MALFKSSDGTKTYSTVQTPKYKYKKANQYGTYWSDEAPPSNIGRVSEANLTKSELAYKKYEDKFGKNLLDKIALKMHGKKFRKLDKDSTLKSFKAKLDKYEDFIIENKRYPTKGEAYTIGLERGGKKNILSKNFTDDVKKRVKKIYASGEGGSPYISKKLAEDGINIDESVLRRYIKTEVDAGRLKRPKKFKTQEATAPKDRYNIIREVTERDKRGFVVGSLGKQVQAPAWSKYKIVFNIPRNPETTLIPKNYQGTQYYKTKEAAEKALEARGKLDLSRTDEAVRVVNRLIKADPDLASDIRTLAQEVYGAAEGATDLAKEQDLERKMRSVATDVTRLQEQLSSKIQGFPAKNISKLILPTGKLAEDILTDITVNTDIGRFGGTAIRNSRMRIISGILNERKGKFQSLRNAVTKFVGSGQHLDEVAGIGATYDVAPGYASFAQSIPAGKNLDKRSAIDLDFARLLRQAVLNEEGPKSFQKVKYNTLGEAINAYNKFSREFAKENKIFTPTIEYSPGKKLDPSKFAPNFTALRPEAKANVLELAERGIGVGVGKAMPFEKMLSEISKLKPGSKAYKTICMLGRFEGGAVQDCVNRVAQEPEKFANKFKNITAESGPLAKIKNASIGFLKSPGFKTFSVAGLAGGAAAALVKEFRNDDPTTYLSNEDQQKNMLVDMVTQPIAPGFSRPDILDYQLPAVGASIAASTALAAPSTIKASRSRGLGVEQKGIIKTGGRVLGRGLGVAASPGVLAPLAALDITRQVSEGDSLADIATDPINYTYPIFAEQTDRLTKGLPSAFRKFARLGMSKPALRLLSRAGIAGLGASLAIQGIGLLDD